jgi:DNA-directed RNA polymerase I, II, and III subunit RPABC2
MPPKKTSSKKVEKNTKKVNFVSNKDENQNIVKENYPVTDNLELNETETEKEKETEQEDEEVIEEEQEEQDDDQVDEDHEVDDEIDYDDENIEEIDDLYDDEDEEGKIKPKKKSVKPQKKKLNSETEDDLNKTELDDEECEYDYNEIYDEKKEEPSVLVKSEDRITLPKLTKYEKVRLIGTRAKQIALGAKVMVKNTSGLNPIDIAKLELKLKMIPMKIKRVLPDNKIEIWKLSELDIDN